MHSDKIVQALSLSCVQQGRIEPPKAARGQATSVDGKMLSVSY